MEIKDLKSLIKMITDTDVSEFRMENKEEKIVIRRGPEKEYVQMATQSAPVLQAPTAAVPQALPGQTAETVASPAAVENERYEKIASPIVGTMYHRPSPDADAFVKVGDLVEAGQTLCLVEAMKLFNEIEAEFKCRVIEILKSDAAPVEYGEALFLVERL